ncbi:MAG: 4-hydroxythreonine-4-phosphate dehydrogenase PdxA [Candidatus Omnitrophica bacterium]|nr:4-hydroxythreonine-4-phosphate dehydrogenase PdxA [Candidatus Omnitrophota bacterium]
MKRKSRILITTGDPRGIGPEITKKALSDPRIMSSADFTLINTCDKTGFDAVRRAADILKKGDADGLVTAPVNKSAINASGVKFSGHTEYLAKITRKKKIAMLFCAGAFRVAIVTRHISLKEVPAALTRTVIKDTILLTAEALRKYFNVRVPRIGVCGLNPHCGEDGIMGTEEKSVIAPIVKKVRSKTLKVEGPLPADVIFYMARNDRFDAVISMYHDQGLAPFKMIAFDKGVNVTLGLPFVRTSPDHGTAYDIAGKGVADPSSMKEAIKLAVKMCAVRC